MSYLTIYKRDDEKIDIDLKSLPSDCHSLWFIVNAYSGGSFQDVETARFKFYDKNKNELINFYKGLNFSCFKSDLADAIVDKISPIGNEIIRLMDDKKYLDKILLEGSKKADKIASDKVKKIQELIGF